jgi:hypothetical protein
VIRCVLAFAAITPGIAAVEARQQQDAAARIEAVFAE